MSEPAEISCKTWRRRLVRKEEKLRTTSPPHASHAVSRLLAYNYKYININKREINKIVVIGNNLSSLRSYSGPTISSGIFKNNLFDLLTKDENLLTFFISAGWSLYIWGKLKRGNLFKHS